MVKVVDAIMGTGKSSAAINYMNDNSSDKFVYIGPYLDEAERIRKSCPKLKFKEPIRSVSTGFSKLNHTEKLVDAKENIATTHQAFRLYTDSLIQKIKDAHYTLIIDEAVNVLETLDIDPDDLDILIAAGCVSQTGNNMYRWTKEGYRGSNYKDIANLLVNHDLVRVQTGEDKRDVFCYWMMSTELFRSFDNIIILTYMFEAQDLRCFMDMNNIPYEYIGISYKDGVYRFSDTDYYVPSYVSVIKDKIHIENDERLNAIGDSRYALSASWFDRSDSDVNQLKNNTYNYFFNLAKTDAKKRMWSTFKSAESKLKGKGYTKGFINFNEKATNEYKDRNVLVYDVNLFVHVGQKIFFRSNGIDIDDDMYALSIMVQWVWRSAIRDGNEIWLYIPSSRMRRIFCDWLDSLTEGGASDE